MTYEIHTTAEFDQWAARIKDKQAAFCLANRLNRAANGNLGDIYWFPSSAWEPGPTSSACLGIGKRSFQNRIPKPELHYH
jgi:hypothetical protein